MGSWVGSDVVPMGSSDFYFINHRESIIFVSLKNLLSYFPKNFKVKVDSDVRCHLRAEKYFGVAKNYKNFAYINIGTGLSYAHFKDKKIYSGAKGYAIHFASSKISLYDWKKNKKISLIPEEYYSGKI